MRKLKTILYKIFCPFANEVWWPNWSNIRWIRAAKTCEVKDEDLVKNLVDIKMLVRKLYSKFVWTKDDATELGDSITPPAQNYLNYLNGKLYDDCDGFHSLVYHCLRASNIQCYLLSVITIDGGHCVLVFNYQDKWYVNDYNDVYSGFATLKEAVEDYNKKYIKIYNDNLGEVVYNGFIHYDYKTGKFRSVKHELKELLK